MTFNLPHYAWSINKIVFFLVYFRKRHQKLHRVLPQQFSQGDISSKAPHVRRPRHSIYKEMEISLGFFGEQGGESIHHKFKLFENTNISVKPASARLKKMLEQHYVVVNPKGRELIPQRATRNLVTWIFDHWSSLDSLRILRENSMFRAFIRLLWPLSTMKE